MTLEATNAALIEEVSLAGDRGLHVPYLSEKYIYASLLEASGVFVSDRLWFRLAQDGMDSACRVNKQQ